MIEIVPSISVIGGKCTRLAQGNYAKKIIYNESPIDIAKRFEAHGIKKIHLIDLEGTKEGRVINLDVLELIAGHTDLHINFTGGIRTDGDYARVMEYGASSVTIGSLAVNDPHLFFGWLISYGREKLALSADAQNGKIKIGGWQKHVEKDLIEHIDMFYKKSILYVKCSEISRDGLMQGPAFELYKSLMKKFPDINIYASGGISSIEDIKKLNEIGVYGAIIGKALYEEKIMMWELEKLIPSG